MRLATTAEYCGNTDHDSCLPVHDAGNNPGRQVPIELIDEKLIQGDTKVGYRLTTAGHAAAVKEIDALRIAA